jgi:hypothetical protein
MGATILGKLMFDGLFLKRPIAEQVISVHKLER